MKKTTKTQQKSNILVESLGWYGATAIAAAYMLVSFDLVSADSLSFQLMNLTGALGIIVVSLAKRNTQLVALNVFWVIIAIIALAGILI